MLQAEWTALLSCTNSVWTDARVYTGLGPRELVQQHRAASTTFSLPLEASPTRITSPTALPPSDDCSTPLCNAGGDWSFHAGSAVSSQAFALDFSESASGRLGNGSSWFYPVHLCSDVPECTAVDSAASAVMLLPPVSASPCAAVVYEKAAASRALQVAAAAANPCPTEEILVRWWPWLLEDGAVVHRCARCLAWVALQRRDLIRNTQL